MSTNYDYDISPMPPLEYDQSEVPELSRKHADYVRNKTYGHDVRESLARGVEYAGMVSSVATETAQDTQLRQDNLETYNDQMIIEMTDKDVVSAPEIVQSRKHSETLADRLDEIEVIKNIFGFGAKGNGIDSDVGAIINGSQSGVTLGFPNGTYVIDEHILIENKKRLKWIALGDDVNFLDIGQAVELSNGEGNTPFGVEFKNCEITFEGFNHDNYVTTSGQVMGTSYDSVVPQIDFNGGKVEFKDNTMSGQVQPWLPDVFSNVNIDEPALEHMKSSYVRFVYCDSIKFDNNTIVTGSGGGEFFSFYKVKNLTIDYPTHVQGDADKTFWSFAKIIDCENVAFNRAEIQSNSTGSLFDVSGRNIIIENINADYPNGKFIDITQEWGDSNVDIDDVLIQNCNTNADIFGFTSVNGSIKTIKNVVAKKINWTPGSKINNNFIVNSHIENLKIEDTILENINYLSYSGDSEVVNNLVVNNSIITASVAGANTTVNGRGKYIFNNCEVDLKFVRKLELRDQNRVENSSSNNRAKFEFNNCVIKNASLNILGDSVFNNCEFVDCSFTTTDNFYPNIDFDNCDFTYTYDFNGLSIEKMMFRLYKFAKLSFKQCEFNGEYYNPSGYSIINPQTLDTTDGIYFDDIKVGVVRTNDKGEPLEGNSGLSFLAVTQVLKQFPTLHRKIHFNDATFSEAMRFGFSATSLLGSTLNLTIKNSEMEVNATSNTGRQLFNVNNTAAPNIRFINFNNILTSGSPSLDGLNGLQFSSYKQLGNLIA